MRDFEIATLSLETNAILVAHEVMRLRPDKREQVVKRMLALGLDPDIFRMEPGEKWTRYAASTAADRAQWNLRTMGIVHQLLKVAGIYWTYRRWRDGDSTYKGRLRSAATANARPPARAKGEHEQEVVAGSHRAL